MTNIIGLTKDYESGMIGSMANGFEVRSGHKLGWIMPGQPIDQAVTVTPPLTPEEVAQAALNLAEEQRGTRLPHDSKVSRFITQAILGRRFWNR